MNSARIGAVSAGVAVLASAFGAHALRDALAPAALVTFETGARYQLFHALALIGVGLADGRADGRWLGRASWAFLIGTVVFSGSLYVLAMTGVRGVGMLTPVGGLALLCGWACLTVALRGSSQGAKP